jgi:hypothetical protein
MSVVAGLIAAPTLTACTHSAREDRVADTVRAYLDAFARKDVTAMASFYTSTCHVRPAQLQETFRRLNQPLRVRVDSVDVTMQSPTTANAVANGTLSVGSHDFPLTGAAGNEEFHLIEINGHWKIANCPQPSDSG